MEKVEPPALPVAAALRAAGLTPGTREEDPYPFSEWIDDGFPPLLALLAELELEAPGPS